jgi:hypothetical protein
MGATQLLRSPSAVGRQSAPVIWAAASEHRNAVSVKPPAPAEQLADTMPFILASRSTKPMGKRKRQIVAAISRLQWIEDRN